MLNDIEIILDEHSDKTLKEIEEEFIKVTGVISEEIIHEMFIEMKDFIYIDPKIPDSKKNYLKTARLKITNEDSREKIMDLITDQNDNSEIASLALYVYRQMDIIDWRPFIKAAIERNPVCFTDLNGKATSDVFHILKAMPDESIYDGMRLALPDEVWNFGRGDGIEKAFLLADFLIHKNNFSTIFIEIDNKKVLLTSDGNKFHFNSNKNLRKSIQIT